jgi:hypothetical protein
MKKGLVLLSVLMMTAIAFAAPPKESTVTSAKGIRIGSVSGQSLKAGEQQIVSWVDTSLDGSEKFVLRVNGNPFYMTNIQIRLDKLRGTSSYNFNATALESVIKRAADDGFNTVSIPIHWREVEPQKNNFDWTILDRYMNWCKKYGIKMELLWFSWSSGGRVQWLIDGQELRTPDYVCSKNGTSEFTILRKTDPWTLDWNDNNLRDREKYVLATVMEHIAVWNAGNGNPSTVIGVQLGNEPLGHEQTVSSERIIDYHHYVGAAVKESRYVVWTRLNCVNGTTSERTNANEAKRANGGTNIDFVGIDIYGTSAQQIRDDLGGQLATKGKNYRMIMESGAEVASAAIYQIAALAGNKAYDHYDMVGPDGHGLYTNNGTTLVARTHTEDVRRVNKIMNLANQDIALKSQGINLYVYNTGGTSTSKELGLEGISFTPGVKKSQAIAIRRSATEIILLVTHNGTFTYPSTLNVKSASKGYFDLSNIWVSEGDVDFSETAITMPENSAVLLELDEAVETGWILNPSFERGIYSSNGTIVPLFWNLEHTVSGENMSLSSVNPADGIYKYSVAATAISAINLYQDVLLTEGNYTLQAVMHGSNTGITDQHIYAQVGNEAPVKSEVLKYVSSPFWQPMNIEFTIPEDETTVRIGAASTGTGTTAGGFQIDDFRLDKKDESGISTIHLDKALFSKPANIYSITGQFVKTINKIDENSFSGLALGLYIVNNKKVIIK